MVDSSPVESRADERRDELAATVAAVIAQQGLEAVTVRRVAQDSGIAIGTVQYYFPTKDTMIAAAFVRVVERTRERLRKVDTSAGPRMTMQTALGQLLPLDKPRRDEARVNLAFAARATVSPALQAQQLDLLRGIHSELETVLVEVAGDASRARSDARILLAGVDGLAQHAVSAPGLLSTAELKAGRDRLIDALLA